MRRDRKYFEKSISPKMLLHDKTSWEGGRWGVRFENVSSFSFNKKGISGVCTSMLEDLGLERNSQS